MNNCRVWKAAHFSLFFITLTVLISLPEITYPEAGKGHEKCSLCHGIHTSKGLRLFPKEFNTQTINPNTGKPLGKLDALCMSCHASEPQGAGIRTLDLTKKHYFGGPPYVVKLPESAGNFKGGEGLFTCLACHDPHPSNSNYRYLRTKEDEKISKSKDMKKFCLWCHPKMEFLLK